MSFFWKGKDINTLQLSRQEALEVVQAGRGYELVAAMAKDRTTQLRNQRNQIPNIEQTLNVGYQHTIRT